MVRWYWKLAQAMTIVAGSVSAVGAQTDPLKVTFRCADSGECPAVGPTDGVQGDGIFQGAYTFDGYHVFTAGKGKGVTYLDGAFLNSNGGIDINLVSAGDPLPNRALQFRFGQQQVDVPGSPPAACNVDGQTMNATDVDFRFNISRPDGTGGIESVEPVGTTVGPSGASGEPTDTPYVVGVVNFKTPTIRGALYFNYSKDAITPWDGEVTLTRVDNDTWTLTSNSTVLLQCAAGSKGRLYDVGTYHMPFQLTVQR